MWPPASSTPWGPAAGVKRKEHKCVDPMAKHRSTVMPIALWHLPDRAARQAGRGEARRGTESELPQEGQEATERAWTCQGEHSPAGGVPTHRGSKTCRGSTSFRGSTSGRRSTLRRGNMSHRGSTYPQGHTYPQVEHLPRGSTYPWGAP